MVLVDINTLINAIVTGSVVGIVTSIMNWLFTKRLLSQLEKFEETLKQRKNHDKET